MNITINGEKKTLAQTQLTLSELLVIESVKMPDMVSVEHNGDMIDKEAFATTQVKEGDVVEFLYFMGGGRYDAAF